MNSVMNAALRRIHWRCRRGMLELDLLFQDFNEGYLHRLDNEQIAALDALLDLPDNDLWDLVANEVLSENAVSQQVLTWLRAAQCDSRSEYIP